MIERKKRAMKSEQAININFNLSSEQASEFSEMFKKRATEKLAEKYHKQGICYLVIHNRKSESESEKSKQVLVFNYCEHIPKSTLKSVIWGNSEKKSERVQSEKVQAFKALMQAILKANKLANTSENIEQVLNAHKIKASEQVLEFLASK